MLIGVKIDLSLKMLTKSKSSPKTSRDYLTWFEMRVDAQQKKEFSFSSLTLFNVSSLVNKWMTLGNQVFMIRSSVLLHSTVILFCRLLHSTGPEALNRQKILCVVSLCEITLLCSILAVSCCIHGIFLTCTLKDQPGPVEKMSCSQYPR